MHRSRAIIAAAAAVFLVAGLAAPAAVRAATAEPARAPAPGSGIISQLKHLPGVTYLGKNAFPPAGYQVYELEIRQPVDHRHPNGATFEQHLELYQRALAAPMVMYVSGYFNYTFLSPQATYLSVPAMIDGANQISVEHRYYGDSVPHPTLWRYLTVWQQAADEHHVVQVFKQLYHARWLISGVSKGGETAIFHDFYYPGDFSGTFAWSAPSITHTFSRTYDNFLSSVGTPACRAALLEAQRRALRHRAAMEVMLAAEAKAAHGTFRDWVSGLDQNFELTVLLTPFVFWQYGGDCSTIPGASATLQQLYNWFDAVAGWLAADDQESAPFFSYNYQAATQMGYPVIDQFTQLGSLLHYPLTAQEPLQDALPSQPVRPLSQGLMRTVHQWFLTRGSHLLLTYGQDDPWSAQRFYLGSGTTDSAIFTIKGGNHVTPFTALPPVQQKTFVDMLRTWAGLSDATGPVQTASPDRVPLATLIGGRH
ncbi:MAG TPA: S28 family serine protease [Streptosporangiaceae bacterium]